MHPGVRQRLSVPLESLELTLIFLPRREPVRASGDWEEPLSGSCIRSLSNTETSEISKATTAIPHTMLTNVSAFSSAVRRLHQLGFLITVCIVVLVISAARGKKRNPPPRAAAAAGLPINCVVTTGGYLTLHWIHSLTKKKVVGFGFLSLHL